MKIESAWRSKTVDGVFDSVPRARLLLRKMIHDPSRIPGIPLRLSRRRSSSVVTCAAALSEKADKEV